MKRILYILMCIATAACSDDGAVLDDTIAEQARTAIDIEATIGEPLDATRGVVTGTFFKNDGTESLGFFVYRTPTAGSPDEYTSYYSKSANVGATLTKVSNVPTWLFNYDDGSNSKFLNFYVLRDVGETHTADFLAYSPWIKGTTDITNIHFEFGDTIAKQPDMMWATENATRSTNRITPGTGKNGTNTNGEPLSKLHFTFKHALACIEFRFRSCKVENNANVRITRLDMKHATGGASIYTGGTMNALTGVITASTETTEKKSYDTGNVSVYTADYTVAIPVLVIPQSALVASLADDQPIYHFDLYFNNGAGTTSTHGFDITPAMIRHTDSSAGLQPGYRYVFKFTIDNYTHLDGITIDDAWHDPEDVGLQI